MKCQILFSGKNKKNIINLSSAENAQRVVKVKKGANLVQLLYVTECIQSQSLTSSPVINQPELNSNKSR